jgi:hypothetical protein
LNIIKFRFTVVADAACHREKKRCASPDRSSKGHNKRKQRLLLLYCSISIYLELNTRNPRAIKYVVINYVVVPR